MMNVVRTIPITFFPYMFFSCKVNSGALSLTLILMSASFPMSSMSNMSRKSLYRRLGAAVIVILTFFGAVSPRGAAQMPQLKRPQDTPEEKTSEDKKPKKKIKGPRAVGLLQLNSSGKGILIPIAILVDGKFYEASAYKADPIPMALESGTVYEVEQTGSSQGLFTINGALHSKAPGSTHPWTGSGSYLPTGTSAAKTTRKAEDVPLGLNSSDSDAPPRLTRGNAAKPAEAGSPNSPPANAPAGSGSSEKPAESAPPASSQPAKGPSGDGSPGKDSPKVAGPPASEKPAAQDAKEQSPSPTAPGQGGSSPKASRSQASAGQKSHDEYRPTLRRGKPAPQADSQPVMEATTFSNSMQFVPAISDDGGPEPRSYKFYWKTGEEEERRSQMLALAADEVRAYANARPQTRIPAKPPAAKAPAAGHRAAAKLAQSAVEDTQFLAFDVWGNNQPVMILSSEAHLPPGQAAVAAPETYSITLVARTDIYGNLRKVYAGVTDKFHLDVTPRLELIDAVDADGDGRGKLLFGETTDAGSGYVIYRATADKLWKMFDSLSAK